MQSTPSLLQNVDNFDKNIFVEIFSKIPISRTVLLIWFLKIRHETRGPTRGRQCDTVYSLYQISYVTYIWYMVYNYYSNLDCIYILFLLCVIFSHYNVDEQNVAFIRNSIVLCQTLSAHTVLFPVTFLLV